MNCINVHHFHAHCGGHKSRKSQHAGLGIKTKTKSLKRPKDLFSFCQAHTFKVKHCPLVDQSSVLAAVAWIETSEPTAQCMEGGTTELYAHYCYQFLFTEFGLQSQHYCEGRRAHRASECSPHARQKNHIDNHRDIETAEEYDYV